MSRTTKSFLAAVVCLSVATFSQAAYAGTFTVQPFASVADLGLNSNYGIVQAVGSAQSSPLTIGAVTFSPGGGSGIVWGSGGMQSAATTGDANLNTLLTSELLTFGATPINVNLTGLTSGLRYQAQLIIYDGDQNDTGPSYRGNGTVQSGADTFTYNAWNTLGVPPSTFTSSKGIFINYDFIATGPTQTISLLNQTANLLAGFDVRVPEPASASLFMVGICGLAAIRRITLRRRRESSR